MRDRRQFDPNRNDNVSVNERSFHDAGINLDEMDPTALTNSATSTYSNQNDAYYAMPASEPISDDGTSLEDENNKISFTPVDANTLTYHCDDAVIAWRKADNLKKKVKNGPAFLRNLFHENKIKIISYQNRVIVTKIEGPLPLPKGASFLGIFNTLLPQNRKQPKPPANSAEKMEASSMQQPSPTSNVANQTEVPSSLQINFDEIDLDALINSEPQLDCNQNKAPCVTQAGSENDNNVILTGDDVLHANEGLSASPQSASKQSTPQTTNPVIAFQETQNPCIISARFNTYVEVLRAESMLKTRFRKCANTPIELKNLYKTGQIRVTHAKLESGYSLQIHLDKNTPIPFGEKSLLDAMNKGILYAVTNPHKTSLRLNFEPFNAHSLFAVYDNVAEAERMIQMLKRRFRKAPAEIQELLAKKKISIFNMGSTVYIYRAQEKLPKGMSLLDLVEILKRPSKSIIENNPPRVSSQENQQSQTMINEEDETHLTPTTVSSEDNIRAQKRQKSLPEANIPGMQSTPPVSEEPKTLSHVDVIKQFALNDPRYPTSFVLTAQNHDEAKEMYWQFMRDFDMHFPNANMQVANNGLTFRYDMGSFGFEMSLNNNQVRISRIDAIGNVTQPSEHTGVPATQQAAFLNQTRVQTPLLFATSMTTPLLFQQARSSSTGPTNSSDQGSQPTRSLNNG